MELAAVDECIIDSAQDGNNGIEVWNAEEEPRVFSVNEFADVRIIDTEKISLGNKVVNCGGKVLLGMSYCDEGERRWEVKVVCVFVLVNKDGDWAEKTRVWERLPPDAVDKVP